MNEDAEGSAEAAGGDASDEAQADAEGEPQPDGEDAEAGTEPLATRVCEEAGDDLGDEVAELESRVEDLKDDLADIEAELEDRTERLQAKQADFQNYKQRAKKKQDQIRERATEDLVERLLDVRDNLGRALEEDGEDVDALREGVELTRKEFDRVLEAEGVEEIRPDAGENVDAQRHEVVMRVDSDQPAGTVVDVYRPGYEMGGRVLRTAQVTVSDDSNGE